VDLFTMLEAKINQMILFAVNLKKENAELKTFVEKLKVENEGLKTENATVVRDNAQLSAQIRSIELSMERGSEQISVLNEEKTLAKIVVDDLIKSIDALVEREDQQ
jgi:hypothetical protein